MGLSKSRSARRYLGAALLTCLASAAPTHAAEVRARAQASDHTHELRIEAILPLTQGWGGSFTHHLRLGHESYSTAGARVRSPYGEYALGYGRGLGRDRWHAALGLQYRELRGDAESAAPERDDPELRLGLHLDGQLQLGPMWTARGNLETYPASGALKVRGRLLREVGLEVALGPEITLERRAEESSQELGLVLQGLSDGPGFESALRAGVHRSAEGDAGPYVGIELRHRF